MTTSYPQPSVGTVTVRAVVYDVVGGPLEVRDVAAPVCPADGVVVDVAATGVCRSDWHAWRGHDPVPCRTRRATSGLAWSPRSGRR